MDQQGNQQGGSQPTGGQQGGQPVEPVQTSQPGSQATGGGQPTGGQPPTTGLPTSPSEGTAPANFQLGALFTEGIKIKVQPHPETKFDDNTFLMLLASSISLSKAEKKRIVDAVPKLKQWQIDELMNIFEEEKKKFAQLSKKHAPQLEKLAKQHFEDWKDLEMGQEREGKQEDEQKKADDIRKSLGL